MNITVKLLSEITETDKILSFEETQIAGYDPSDLFSKNQRLVYVK